MTMTNQELCKQLEKRAAAELAAGASIEINNSLPYVALTMSDGEEYFFQGEAAEELLNEVPDWINEEDYFLAHAQNW